MITRLSTALFAMVMLLAACNKKNEPVPGNPQTPAPPFTLNDLLGTYTGIQHHHKIVYAYGMGQTYYLDTGYTTNDTITVFKTGTDSFTLSNPSWGVYNMPFRFKLNTSNIYSVKGPNTTGAAADTVMIRFDVNTDSMVIEKFEGTTGTSGYHRYSNKFFGKKK